MSSKVLFLGRFFSPNNLLRIKEDTNGNIGFSNHNFEMSILDGLSRHREVDTSAITLPSYYSYPQNSKTFYVKEEKYDYHNIHVTSVGFCNLFFINKISSVLHLLFNILRYFHTNKWAVTDIIINTPKCSLLLAALLSKCLNREKITITLIIPDIPSMITTFNEGGSLLKKLVSIEDRIAMQLSYKCDYYVLLTEDMKEFLKNDIIYTVVEGLIDEKKYINRLRDERAFNEKQIILYSGTLNKFFGVIKLLDAFESLHREDAELWICGSGDTRDEIHKRSEFNKNIRFLGLVDADKVKDLQIKADILVNPRGSEGEFTKYSFPSKTMEYLATGNVVVANKLPGIPREYYDYIICPKDESIQALSECLNNVLNLSEEDKRRIGENNREFVVTQKNSYKQVGKILDMVFNSKQ